MVYLHSSINNVTCDQFKIDYTSQDNLHGILISLIKKNNSSTRTQQSVLTVFYLGFVTFYPKLV